MDTFEHHSVPNFPKLTWKLEWEGKIVLPSWADFQSRQGAYGAMDQQNPSEGLAKIRLNSTIPGEKESPPSAQINAIEYLLNNEEQIKTILLERILPYYTQLRIDWGVQDEDWLPSIKSTAALKNMIGPSNIHISNVEQAGIAYLGFELGCMWDEEHGLGIMLHKDRIIEIGGADTSFLSWIAQKDKESYEL